MGLKALTKQNAILDMRTQRLHFLPDSEWELTPSLPEGTRTFQIEKAPSGHLILPCCEYPDESRDPWGPTPPSTSASTTRQTTLTSTPATTSASTTDYTAALDADDHSVTPTPDDS